MAMNIKVILGATLLFPIVFFGLGLAGFGDDHLLAFVQSVGVTGGTAFKLSKLIFGIITGAAVVLLTLGYLDQRDGKIIPTITKG
ncbi:MAG: hypothetical protein C9356_20060 [Oleiphilus sp.]|nr:MAG: hypothetical protein C9356_20060 [Oleiphilus sp.]